MLVDDHPLWRQMLRQVLEHKSAGSVVGEASSGEEAVSLAASLNPDVVIMDMDLPGIDGVEATRRLLASSLKLKVLVLSAYEEKEAVIEAVQAGASGYLPKTSAAGEVADAVERVWAGEVVFPPSLAAIVLEEFRRRAGGESPFVPASGRRSKVGRWPTSGRDQPLLANAFTREGDFWTVVYGGEVSRVRDSKGMWYIAQLLRRGGDGIHVSDLVLVPERTPTTVASAARGLADAGLEATRPRDAGAVLDPEAKAAYRRRLLELESEVEEAESWNDPERAAKARDEMDFLTRELAAAVGLGGRDRRAVAPVERFRVNVSRAVKGAIRRIAEAHPALGTHLDRSIHTGTFCSYRPSEATKWIL